MNSIRIVLLLMPVLLVTSCSPRVTEKPDPVKEEGRELPPKTTRIWKDTDTLTENASCPGKIFPTSFRFLIVDTAQIRHKLLTEGDFPGVVSKDTVIIEVPMPDGTWENFRISQVQVMAPVLAAKYPYIKTYSGKSMLYPADQVRLEVNGVAVRIMILSTRGTIMLEAFCPSDMIHMISFYKKNLPEGAKQEFEKN